MATKTTKKRAQLKQRLPKRATPVKRDANGHFQPGTCAGPGNPFGKAVAEWRAAIVRAVTPADIERVVGVLLAAALEGEQWAICEILKRTCGKPETTLEASAQLVTAEYLRRQLQLMNESIKGPSDETDEAELTDD